MTDRAAPEEPSLLIGGKTYSFSSKKLSELARANIYPGVCENNHAKVVIKYVDQSDPEHQRYMRTEIKRLQKLPCHPNIIKLLEYGDIGNITFIIMERMNKDLFDFLFDDNKRNLKKIMRVSSLELKERVIRSIMKPILKGIEHLHNNNVCHLDIKLENVLVSREMNFVVSDFEFARKIKDKNNNYTVSEITGTQDYFCPEMNETSYINGEKADVYSLGVMLFSLTFGDMPFSGKTNKSVLTNYAKLDMWDMYRTRMNINIGENVSAELWDTIESMLYFRPEERATVDEVLDGAWFSKETLKREDLKKFFE